MFMGLFLTFFTESSMVPYDNFRSMIRKTIKGEKNEKV